MIFDNFLKEFEIILEIMDTIFSTERSRKDEITLNDFNITTSLLCEKIDDKNSTEFIKRHTLKLVEHIFEKQYLNSDESAVLALVKSVSSFSSSFVLFKC